MVFCARGKFRERGSSLLRYERSILGVCLQNFCAIQLCSGGRVRLNFAEQNVPEQEVAIGGIGMGLKILTSETIRLVDASLLQECVRFGEQRVARLRGRRGGGYRGAAGGGGGGGGGLWGGVGGGALAGAGRPAAH